ncbi:NAD(P)-binding protein [Cryphonectria parasitica EP155]|uniref:NAD(P)-binding protein n=1 Tax=Cryphonectria parasitica (strain ATCC 38755 / EP155) TaxID=660469 RepID=A0A9P4YEP2_CRYP1|nr:NAD(P)-binding protein [Cryphonectria parasitica EP155]KAF3771075.1 NAD(P)-binding protein [Cryphonectria parasitica EP155]
MADDILKTPYQTYHRTSYAAIDPTQPALSTKSKSAVVTGAGSGIGAGIAVSLAKSAVSYIALIGRRQNALEETKSAIEAVSASSQVYIYTVDITDLTAIDEALKAFARECASGTLDILIANAGSLGCLSSIRNASPAEWWNGFETNVKGNFNLVHAFLPRASTASAIVHISSAVIHGPYFPNESSYCASKAGAAKLFEYVHHEHPEMFVLCLQPGLVAETGVSAGFENIAKGMQVEMASLPWDNVALPGDFVVWAVSPEAHFLNGRFVWANWDVDELKDDKDAILADPHKFTMGLIQGL